MAQLEVDGVWLEFGLKKILTDIYLKCETGKITALLARNGQGKSCLVNIISGNLTAASSSVRIDGGPVLKYKPGILMYLPQFNFVPGSLTLKRVWEDFELDFERFERIFPEFASKYNERFAHLSGGQRRLCEVFLISTAKTKFILLDEPFSHIMPLHIEKVKEILLEERLNKGILMTDHLYRQVIALCDSLYVLENGKTTRVQNPKEEQIPGYNKLYPSF